MPTVLTEPAAAFFPAPWAALAARYPALVVWPASRLGEQLHIGSEPGRERFNPPSMDVADRWPHFGQPSGGFYTAPRLLDGGSSFVNLMRPSVPDVLTGGWWLVTPDPSAPVLVLDTAADFERALERFRYGERNELDYPALAAAGFAAVHVLCAWSADSGYGAWLAGETLFLRWAFTAPATRVDGIGDEADIDRPIAFGLLRRSLLPPWDAETFTIMVPPPPAIMRGLAYLTRFQAQPWDEPRSRPEFDAIVHGFVMAGIASHTFTDADGRPLPKRGEPLARALHAQNHNRCMFVWHAICASALRLKAHWEHIDALSHRISAILPGQLSVSGRVAAGKVRAAGVDLITDLVNPNEEWFPEGFGGAAIERFPMTDHWPRWSGPLPPEYALRAVVGRLAGDVAAGRHVLVACSLGLNRAPFVAALVLAAVTGSSGREALAVLRERRGRAVLRNAAFVAELERVPARPGAAPLPALEQQGDGGGQ